MRAVRITAIVVARKNAMHHLGLAERCASMAEHWRRRAEHHRDAADRWADISIAGAHDFADDRQAAAE